MLKQDHYALLGIEREADTQAIERACAGALSVTSDSAERARLRHARDTLCSHSRRVIYDRSLRTIPTPPRGLGSSTAKPAKRSASTEALRQPHERNGSKLRIWLSLGALVAAAGSLSYVYLIAKPKAANVPAANAASLSTGHKPPQPTGRRSHP